MAVKWQFSTSVQPGAQWCVDLAQSRPVLRFGLERTATVWIQPTTDNRQPKRNRNKPTIESTAVRSFTVQFDVIDSAAITVMQHAEVHSMGVTQFSLVVSFDVRYSSTKLMLHAEVCFMGVTKFGGVLRRSMQQ